jgi:hypothetical protein
MKRLIGILLLTVGLLSMALFVALWAVWSDHTNTVGLSLNAERVFAGVLAAGIICLPAGSYLIAKGRRPRTN